MAGEAEAIAALGAIPSYFAGRSAAKAQKELSRRQAQIIAQQGKLFQSTSPYYQQLVQQAAGNALGGYGGPGSAAQMFGGSGQPQGYGQNPYGNPMAAYQPGNLQGVQNQGYGGMQPQVAGQPNFGGLTPEDNLRLRAAEEDINRYGQQGANQLRFNANLSGLNSGGLGAQLARNEQEKTRQYAQFRRGLAVNAPEQQMQRYQQLAGLLNPGLGQGAAASAGYGQQAGLYGQQADAGYAGVGQALQNYQYQRALSKYGQNAQGIPKPQGPGGESPRAYGARRGYYG